MDSRDILENSVIIGQQGVLSVPEAMKQKSTFAQNVGLIQSIVMYTKSTTIGIESIEPILERMR